MKLENLMSNIDFGKFCKSEAYKFNTRLEYLQWYEITRNKYDRFLLEKLEIWQFVACKLLDGIWVVLEEPKECNCMGYTEDCFGCKHAYPGLEYQQAKNVCIFEGFEYKKEIRNSGGNYTHLLKNNDFEIYIKWAGFYVFGKSEKKVKTIEDLVKYNLKLTATAQKQL